MQCRQTTELTLATLIVLVFTAATQAQRVDPDRWGGGATNPSGQQAVPIVGYESDTGILFLNTLGLNQLLDTTGGSLIGGDDVGLISLSVAGPPAHTVFLNGFIDQSIGGIAFNGTYFNGKQQIFGIPVGAEFLQPALSQPAFQYDADLGSADFGIVEMAVNFITGQPGATLFGSVQVIQVRLDFNGDRIVDCGDLDELTAIIASDQYQGVYDLNEDGRVDLADLDAWLADAGNDQFGHPFLIGDANLDGFVDTTDFHLWNQHKFTLDTGFCSGNFNADERIDVSDFNLWLANRFRCVRECSFRARTCQRLRTDLVYGRRHQVEPLSENVR